jgi:hypothetical protein
MPRVLVVADNPEHEVIMSEHVVPGHLDTAHGREQLAERLAWGVDDAVVAERASGPVRPGANATSYLEIGA